MNSTEERDYIPTKQQRAKDELISIELIRSNMGNEVANFTDEQLEELRDKLYALSNFIYYDWIDSMKK